MAHICQTSGKHPRTLALSRIIMRMSYLYIGYYSQNQSVVLFPIVHATQKPRPTYFTISHLYLLMSNPAKKTRLEHQFQCLNTHCPKPGGFNSKRGLHIHYGKSVHCAAHAAACQDLIQQNIQARPPLSASQTWDVDDEDTTSFVCLDNSSPPTANDSVIVETLAVNTFESNQSSNCLGIKYTTEQFTETKLLKILNDAAAPHFLYQDILSWAEEAKRNQYSFRPERLERSAQVKYLEKWLHLQPCRPETVKLVLPGPSMQAIQVTRFNFTNQLHSLLSDNALCGNLENLDVNPLDPFAKYVSPSGRLSTVNSGFIYNLAHKNRCKQPNDFLVGIIFACDETKLRQGSKAGCWPLMFTVSILNQKMRNLPIAWKSLGYIFDLSMIQSKADAKGQSNDLKSERLHAIFKVILSSFVEAQKEGALNYISLTLGNHTKRVNLKPICFFIIGDMQGGDKISCTAAAYTNTMKRMCRKCNVQGCDTGDPFIKCQRMSMIKIMELVRRNRRDILNNINQYNVHSAWFDVDYGGCRFGIFSAATPVEPLHALENGLILDCVQILFSKEMTPRQKRDLDDLVRRLTVLPRQRYASSGAEPLMPRLLWKDGVTSLTELSAKYKIGIMFTIVIVSLQDAGKVLLEEVLGSNKRLNDMRQVFQMMLAYWVWLKKETYWVRGDHVAREGARTAISTMLRDLSSFWPRTKGQGWEKAKNHEQLHVPDDIDRNGACQNYHTGPTEHNHIFHVKRLARATQRRRETLDQQIAKRASESYVIDYAYQRMVTPSDDKGATDVFCDGESTQSSKGLVYVYIAVNGSVHGRYHATTGILAQTNLTNDRLHEGVLTFLATHYASQPASTLGFSDNLGDPCCHSVIQISSEYKRGDDTFRAHRNYRQNGPWYDWVMFRWEKSEQIVNRVPDCCVEYLDNTNVSLTHDYAPGQILAFVVYPVEIVGVSPSIMAVVKTCTFIHKKGSVFSTIWQQDYEDTQQLVPSLILVNVDCIVRHCLMIPIDDAQNHFMEIWHRERWADEFYQC